MTLGEYRIIKAAEAWANSPEVMYQEVFNRLSFLEQQLFSAVRNKTDVSTRAHVTFDEKEEKNENA